MWSFFSSVIGLKFLVRLCTDMNLGEAQEYANKLKKAEKMQKIREDVCPSIDNEIVLFLCIRYQCLSAERKDLLTCLGTILPKGVAKGGGGG